MMGRALRLLLTLWGGLSLLAVLLAGALLLTAGWWLRVDDEARPADAIVILAGDRLRAVHGADLYLQGLAPVVYVGRPMYAPPQELADLGLLPPRQEDDMLRILTAKGVPAEAVRQYGQDVLSTVEEAESLARVLPPEVKTLLVVTSPWHSRRTKLILSRLLPGVELVSSPSPHERFERKWWTHQASAKGVTSEIMKFLFYALGQPFRSNAQGAAQ